MVITGSIADKQGRCRPGDRVLAVQGRVLYPNVVDAAEARTLLKAPADTVNVVLARPLDPSNVGMTSGMSLPSSVTKLRHSVQQKACQR